MAKETITMPHRIVVLIAASGDILTHFTSDREEFPAIATHGRERIFSLIFQGDLASLPGMEMPGGIAVAGAMYKEVEAWRISGGTINKPRPIKRCRRSAIILPFHGKGRSHG